MSPRILIFTAISSLLVNSILIAADPPKDKDAELLEAVKKLDIAFSKRDKETIRQMTDPNHLSISPSFQFFNRKDQLKALPELNLTQFKSEQKKVIHTTPRTALVAYEANIEGTYAGKKLTKHVQIVESWVKRKGKWIETSYQETPLP